ncbi:MAG: metallophosphoesterase family protein [Nanoarchaeota archaeon]|nr:metallophosphoesterase family protein [Nanoarchaeota archaeon]
MKILAASDVHGDKSVIEKLVAKAKKEKVDLIILAGDLTFFENDLTGIIGPFKELEKKIIIIPGNHETFATAEFLAKQYGPGVYNLHGRSVLFYNEIGIFGAGGADVGLFQIGDEEIEKLLEKAHKPIKDAKHKILVTHIPPYGTNIDALWQHVGSKGVRRVIEKIQPEIALCGHIHETFGKSAKIGKTTVVNVGKDGIIIEIKKKKD